MNFFLIFSFASCCLYQVQGEMESISKFEESLEKSHQIFIDFDDQFFGSIVQSLSTLRQISSDVMFQGWNATCTLKNVLSPNTQIAKQKECLELEKTKWQEKLRDFNSELYLCLFNYRTMGNPIREKFQNAGKEVIKIQLELSEIKRNCSIEPGKSQEECIDFKVKDLKISFERLLQENRLYQIEAGTFLPNIFIQSLNCNSKILATVYELSNQFQEKFKNCVL